MADRHAPDSLKYQWRLYALVSRSTWATGLDKSIAYEIIDNYYPKFGNARASLRYLQQATCAERPNVMPLSAGSSSTDPSALLGKAPVPGPQSSTFTSI